MYLLKTSHKQEDLEAAQLQLEVMQAIENETEDAKRYVWYLSVFLYEYIKYTSSFNKTSNGNYHTHHQLPNIVYKMEKQKQDSMALRPYQDCKSAIQEMLSDFTSDVMFITYPHYTLYITNDMSPEQMQSMLEEVVEAEGIERTGTPEEQQEQIKNNIAKSLGLSEDDVEIVKLISSTVVMNGVPVFTVSSSEHFWGHSVNIIEKAKVDRGVEDILGLFSENPELMPQYMQGDEKNYEDCEWFLERAEGVHYLTTAQFYQQYFKKFDDLPTA